MDDEEDPVGSEQAHPPTVATEPSPGVVKKAVAASAIGNATEWFDYGIYAYGVTYISAAIFPGAPGGPAFLALETFAGRLPRRPPRGRVRGAAAHPRCGRSRRAGATMPLA